VYDAQYTPEQLYGERKGWGHSTWLEGVRIARECGIRRLILSHHNPESDEGFVDGLVNRARELLPNIEGASEGLEIDFSEDKVVHAYEASSPRKERRFSVELPIRLTWDRENGRPGEAQGLLLNVSRSAVYFLAPNNIPADRILEVTIPNELTSHGEMISRFTALPTRKNWVNRTLAGNGSCGGGAGAPNRGLGYPSRIRECSRHQDRSQMIRVGRGPSFLKVRASFVGRPVVATYRGNIRYSSFRRPK
jgi:hypothetical protein